jgi:hypothetical protein
MSRVSTIKTSRALSPTSTLLCLFGLSIFKRAPSYYINSKSGLRTRGHADMSHQLLLCTELLGGLYR